MIDFCAPIVLDENTYQNMADHKALITCQKQQMSGFLIKDSLMSNSKKYAIEIYEKAKQILGADKCVLYAGSDWHDSEHVQGKTREAVKLDHLKNINQAIQQFDFVAMTPTITAGISIEIEHFDKVYGYFGANTVDALTAVHMVGRVRNIREKTLVLCFSAQRSNYSQTINDIFDDIDLGRTMSEYSLDNFNQIDTKRGCYKVDRDDFNNKVYAHNILEKHRSSNDFGLYMCQILKRTGISFSPLTETTRVNKQSAQKLEKELAVLHQKVTEKDYDEYLAAEITKIIGL